MSDRNPYGNPWRSSYPENQAKESQYNFGAGYHFQGTPSQQNDSAYSSQDARLHQNPQGQSQPFNHPPSPFPHSQSPRSSQASQYTGFSQAPNFPGHSQASQYSGYPQPPFSQGSQSPQFPQSSRLSQFSQSPQPPQFSQRPQPPQFPQSTPLPGSQGSQAPLQFNQSTPFSQSSQRWSSPEPSSYSFEHRGGSSQPRHVDPDLKFSYQGFSSPPGPSQPFSRDDPTGMSWEDFSTTVPDNLKDFRGPAEASFKGDHESEALQGALIDNSKQHVILFCQRNGLNPEVNFQVEGPDHMRIYTALVRIKIPNGPLISKTSSHRSKKEAEKIAFDKILQDLSDLKLLSTIPSRAFEDSGSQVVARKKEVREFCEKHLHFIPEATYRSIGPDHAPTFEARLTIPPLGISGVGEAKTKKDAEKIAYAIVYEQLKSTKLEGMQPRMPSRPSDRDDAASMYSMGSMGSSRSSDRDETASTHSFVSQASKSSSAYSTSSFSSFSSSSSSSSLGMNSPLTGKMKETPLPFSQGLSPSQMYARSDYLSPTYVFSPFPITPETTDRSKKFLTFYCDHFRFQLDIIEDKSAPGVPNAHYVTVLINGAERARSKGSSKAEARGHCFNWLYDYLRHQHSDIVDMFDSVMIKNPHGLENLVEIELHPKQKERIAKICNELKLQQPYERNLSSFDPKVPPIFYPEHPSALEGKSKMLYRAHVNRLSVQSQLRNDVAKLPIASYRLKILQAIQQNQVIVVCAETGSGKTTQTPQFIFDYFIEQERGAECNIIVTQPRRISAMTVALRVAEERGGELGKTVGYNIRFEAVLPQPNGCIMFCTTGILLRMLQSNADLPNVSHLILDEVHERDINNDFLMILVKELIKKRPLKVILMSATINHQLFSEYFDNCPIVEIPGKMFHVEPLYLEQITPLLHENRIIVYNEPTPHRKEIEDEENLEENFNPNDPMSLKNIPFPLIESILVYISLKCSEGSVLVFLPGWEQIRELAELLRRDRFQIGFANPNYFEIHCLHSSISSLHQHEVFRPVPRGVRKIVLCTNIAETSITIPDVVYVIDTVRQKEMNYIASRRMSCLDIAWISRANARQRMGRAGRVRPGVYFCLVSRERFHSLPEHQVPEMYRLDLQEICLSVKALGFPSIREFLNKALQPPDWKNVDSAVERLRQLQALDYLDNITPLGKLLALLPVDPGLGKMLFSSIILGCLDPILTIIAASTTKDPFINTPERKTQSREKRISFSRGTNSDHLAIVSAYNEWRKASSTPYLSSFCDANCLSQPNLQTIRRIKEQLFKTLMETGFIPPTSLSEPFGGEELNRAAGNPSVIKALLCSGFYPNYAERAKKRMYRTKEDKTTFVHPSSVNYKGGSTEIEAHSPFCVFQEKFKTARIFLTNTTQVSPLGIILFGGLLDTSSGGSRTLMMDDWLVFSCAEQDVKLIASLRDQFDSYLRRCYANPQLVQRQRPEEKELVEVIIDISSS